ncbi:TetR/AcrR family transcriptional regulator [Gorillibacterium timonense]|uniref:TetR/AcrR family transcriptional regulator n=1 Tax=Gorillibacterium timonense TaxID=1689269 RepID=UPI00071D3C03|nr:TetR/AcrR family transcriptional regulator [Gorillibacterium timonense]
MSPVVSDSHKKQKKQVILRNALYCFARKGYQQTTIDDIAAQAGLSKGAIYHYFRSKEEIYFEVVNENTAGLNSKLAEELEPISNALDKLAHLFDTYLSNSHLDPDVKDLFQVYYEFRLQSCRDEAIAGYFRNRRGGRMLPLVEEIVRGGQTKGEIRRDRDATVAAQTFWALIDGASISIVTDDGFPYQETLMQMKSMFLMDLAPAAAN